MTNIRKQRQLHSTQTPYTAHYPTPPLATTASAADHVRCQSNVMRFHGIFIFFSQFRFGHKRQKVNKHRESGCGYWALGEDCEGGRGWYLLLHLTASRRRKKVKYRKLHPKEKILNRNALEKVFVYQIKNNIYIYSNDVRF